MVLMMLYILQTCRTKAFERNKSYQMLQRRRRRRAKKHDATMLCPIEILNAEAGNSSSAWLLDTGASVSITDTDEGVKNITQTRLGLLGFMQAATQNATRKGTKTIELNTRQGGSISIDVEVIIVKNSRKKILSWAELKARGWMLKSTTKDTYLRTPRIPGEAFRYVPVYTRDKVLYIREEDIAAEIKCCDDKGSRSRGQGSSPMASATRTPRQGANAKSLRVHRTWISYESR